MSTSSIKLTGFEKAEEQLKRMPYDLRGKYLEKAVKGVVDDMVKESTSVLGSMTFAERLTKQQRSAKRLRQSVRAIFRRYENGKYLVAIGGPVKDWVGRHAHLVEFGFRHVTGGTIAGSGTRRRKTVRYSRKAAWEYRAREARCAVNPARTGKGVIGDYVEGRPYIQNVYENHRERVNAKIVAALRSFAKDLANG